MKGIELPINILVVVAIAVIVLLGMVALYFVGFNPFGTAVNTEGVKNDACGILVRGGCTATVSSITTNFDANKDGKVGGYTGRCSIKQPVGFYKGLFS